MAKLLTICKDGGPLSTVWAYILIECKALFSIMLMLFKDGSREAYHSHAFNSYNWVLSGQLRERQLNGRVTVYRPSWRPVYVPRERFHKVVSVGNTWVLSFRGPWAATWQEYVMGQGFTRLTYGRQEVAHG